MSDTEHIRLVVAEMRAAQLLQTLRAAVAGDHHWRRTARFLLAQIDDLRPPPKDFEEAA